MYRQTTRNSHREWQYHMLHVYNCILLKMSTWGSKHVEENSILWINNNQCIKLVINIQSLLSCTSSWHDLPLPWEKICRCTFCNSCDLPCIVLVLGIHFIAVKHHWLEVEIWVVGFEYFEELSSLPDRLLSPSTFIVNAQFLCYWLLLSVITLNSFYA